MKSIRLKSLRVLIPLVCAFDLMMADAPLAAPAPFTPPGASDWRTPDPENVVVFDTNKGRIIVELTPEVAPAHVVQIRALVRSKLYDGLLFFRVVDEFMDQTGDPTNTGMGGSMLPDLKAEFTFRRAIGPGTPFTPVATVGAQELGFVGSMPAASQLSMMGALTADKKVEANGLFCPGVMGMARSGDPDSANSQFFFMRATYPSLNKQYTPWGVVLSGLDVVKAIKTGEPPSDPMDRMVSVRMLSDIPASERPQIRVVDTKTVWFKTAVQMLQAQLGAGFSVCDIVPPVEVK